MKSFSHAMHAGSMNRRRLMQTGFAGIGALASGSLAMAGSAAAQDATPFGEPQATGGTAIIAVDFVGNPRTFVGTSYYSTQAFFVGKLLYTPLLFLDPKWQNLGPGLATSWAWNDDGTVLTLDLRDDVVFHDGEPFTAEDVEFTYRLGVRHDRYFTQRDVSLFAGGTEYKDGTTEEFPGVQIIDEHKVQFTLTSPTHIFELRISNCGILPKHLFSDDVLTGDTPIEELPFFNGESGFGNGLPVGTGPWKAVEYAPETNLTLERHDDYFLGTPILDGVVLRLNVTGPALVAGIESGEFDSAYILEPDSARSLESNEQVAIDANHDLANETALMIATEKEYMSVPVRQALLMALDIESFFDTLTYGYGIPAPSIMMHESLFPNESLPTYAYDPEKARQLLDDAGWDWDYTIKFGQFTTQGSPDNVAAAIMSQWTDLGLKVEFVPLDDAAQVEIGQSEDHPYDVTFNGLAWLAYDPSSSLTTFGCEYRPNYANYCNPDYDEAMQAAIQTPTLEAAVPLYQTAQTILQTELPFVPLWIMAETWAVNTRMHGGTLRRGPLNNIQSHLWWKQAE